MFLFFRTVMAQGDGKPDPAPAVANAETTRIYPLWEVEKSVKPMEFPDASGQHINMMYPTDAAFIKTSPGRDFLVALRLYGAEDSFYDQTWKPDDIVKVEK